MISLVICSNNDILSDKLSENIRATIGMEHEILIIDNKSNNYDIFTAYNQGVKQSKYEFICFCHNDIQFHTENWGSKLLQHFSQDEDLALLGIAGSDVYPKVPSNWESSNLLAQKMINIIQHFKNGMIIHENTLENNNNFYPAVVIDGVFMCFRKDIFEKISFDSEYLYGFHGYDLDICMQVLNQKKKLGVIGDVLIEHFSEGNYTKEYIMNNLKIHQRWQNQLPAKVCSKSFSTREWVAYELHSLLLFTYVMQKAGINIREIRKVIVKNMLLIRRIKLFKPFFMLIFLIIFGSDLYKLKRFLRL